MKSLTSVAMVAVLVSVISGVSNAMKAPQCKDLGLNDRRDCYECCGDNFGGKPFELSNCYAGCSQKYYGKGACLRTFPRGHEKEARQACLNCCKKFDGEPNTKQSCEDNCNSMIIVGNR